MIHGCRVKLTIQIQYETDNRTLLVAAALNVTEPHSTGIGGDMFCLFYNAKTKKIHALNGSGRYPANGNREQILKDLGADPAVTEKMPSKSVLAVTTPGAAAGWVDTIEKFGSGKLSLEQILAPAIALAEDGFPVSECSSFFVSRSMFDTDVSLLTP